MINIAIAATILVAYTVTLCVANQRIPDSLSQSVFMLPPVGAWLWTAVIGTIAFLIVPTILDAASANTQWMAFLAIAGLLFVAVCPLIPEGNSEKPDTKDMTYKIHMAGAILCAVMSQLFIACNNAWLLLCFLPFIGYFIYTIAKHEKWRTKTFWAEMTCFFNVFAFLGIYLF
jgi:hypothetical protein